MEVHIDEIVRAILVANDENLAGRAPALRFQALEYLTQFQQRNFTLISTPNSIPPLVTLLHNTSLAIRSAALQAITRLLETRVQEPSEEVYLIQLAQELTRGTVLTTLEEKTRSDQSARREGGEGDEGEESFREALGRCASTLGQEIMQILLTVPNLPFIPSFDLTVRRTIKRKSMRQSALFSKQFFASRSIS